MANVQRLPIIYSRGTDLFALVFGLALTYYAKHRNECSGESQLHDQYSLILVVTAGIRCHPYRKQRIIFIPSQIPGFVEMFHDAARNLMLHSELKPDMVEKFVRAFDAVCLRTQ